jgi:hypothetical protein
MALAAAARNRLLPRVFQLRAIIALPSSFTSFGRGPRLAGRVDACSVFPVRLSIFSNGRGCEHVCNHACKAATAANDEANAVTSDRQGRTFANRAHHNAKRLSAIAIKRGARIEAVPHQLAA